MNNAPQISIIVGAQNARNTIRDCLRSLTAQDDGAEIIVVDGSTDGTADIVASEFPKARLLREDPRRFVPHLWKAGLDRAQGDIIAFTIAHCITPSDWRMQILAAHQEQEVAGVGGPLDGPINGSAMDWALYFVRYNAFLPPGKRGGVQDIAGDNAAYKRADLMICQETMKDGFWETLVHNQLRAAGRKLVMVPEVCVRLSGGSSDMAAVRTRFWHGRHYGSTRPGNTLTMRIVRTLASPGLIPVLLARIYRRVKGQRPDWLPQFWRVVPQLLLFTGAWSLGEASGYVMPQRTPTG
jgi:glycosyltransferase involved in cell wall biosynthesis